MELLGVIFELLLWLLDGLMMTADIYSWFKGKPNRIERREAKKVGVEPPPKDKWNRGVVALTLAVCLLTLGLLMFRRKIWG